MPTEVQFTANHFRSDLSEIEKRALFADHCRYVEIELFTYCNRKCWFCPNAKIPQRQDKAGNQWMAADLYERIIGDLWSIGYRGQIQFGRYNEPLADRKILDKIGEAARALPKAWLYTHTNGDFLTREYLDALKAAGLSEVAIQTYLGNEQRYDERLMAERMAIQLDKLRLRISKVITNAPGFRHYFETDYQGMVVRIDSRNFDAIGTDRGGVLPIRQGPRTAPCMIPFSNLYIDWNGSVMPCCNLRSDVPEHADCIVSRLGDGASIFDAYAAMHGWRLSLMRFGPKSGPCATCRYDEDEVGVEAAEGLEQIYELATEASRQ